VLLCACVLIWVLGCAPSQRPSGKHAPSSARRRTAAAAARGRSNQTQVRPFSHSDLFEHSVPLIASNSFCGLVFFFFFLAEDPESDSIVYGCSDDGTARRRRRREGQAARGGDGVRLRRRAGHVVHARPDNKDWGSQWQLVTAGNCPFMHFPRATKVEMQTWCT
jgi:hypothetical protein